MSIASLADSTSSSLSSVAGSGLTPQKRTQSDSNSLTTSDNSALATQFLAVTPPVQLSDAGQLQASLSSLQTTANSVAASLSSVAVPAVSSAAASTPVVLPTSTAPQVSQSSAGAGVVTYSEVGTLNVSTGTFIPGTGQVASSSVPGQLSAKRISEVANAQVLQNVLGFQLAYTGAFEPVAPTPSSATAASDAATAAVASGLSVTQQTKVVNAAQSAAKTAAGSQQGANTTHPQAATPATLTQGAQALVGAVNQLAAVAASQPNNSDAQAAAVGVANVFTGAGQQALAQIGITPTTNGAVAINTSQFQQALTNNSQNVANTLNNTAQQLGQVASNALNAPAQASDRASITGVSNGENPYVQQTVVTPMQQSAQSSLVGYSPSSQHVYGLAQYLSVSGL